MFQNKKDKAVKAALKNQKGGKKKKINLKFTIDCTHPAEDGIFDMVSFVSILKE